MCGVLLCGFFWWSGIWAPPGRGSLVVLEFGYGGVCVRGLLLLWFGGWGLVGVVWGGPSGLDLVARAAWVSRVGSGGWGSTRRLPRLSFVVHVISQSQLAACLCGLSLWRTRLTRISTSTISDTARASFASHQARADACASGGSGATRTRAERPSNAASAALEGDTEGNNTDGEGDAGAVGDNTEGEA